MLFKTFRSLNLGLLSVPIFLLLAGFLFVFKVNYSQAAINEKINYQGRLTNSSGQVVSTGPYDVVFKLYTAAGGAGAPIWSENWTNASLFTDSGTTVTIDGCAAGVDLINYTSNTNEGSLAVGQSLWNSTLEQSAIIQSLNATSNNICVYHPLSNWSSGQTVTNRLFIKNGLFSVMLGSFSSFAGVDFKQTLYLGVTIGADSEMSPRKPLGVVPAAIESSKLLGYTWDTPGILGEVAPNLAYFTAIGVNTTSTPEALNVNGAIKLGNTASSTTGAIRFDGSNFQGYDGLQWTILDSESLTKNLTGFPNRMDTSLSFDNSTRNFTITGTNFKIYNNGQSFTKNTQSIQIGAAANMYYIYYDASGVLQQTSTPWGFFGVTHLAMVYWDGTTGLVWDQRHGISLSTAAHEYLHNTIGTRFDSGLSATFATTTFSISSGIIYDEDLKFSIAATTTTRVFYNDGAIFKFTSPQSQYYHKVSNVLQYDSGVPTDVTDNYYVAYWVFASTDKDYPIYSLMGNREDSSLADAQANNHFETLLADGMPLKEMKLLYRVILQRSGTDVVVADTQDLRSADTLATGNYVASAHGALTGLDNDDHLQYMLLAGRDGGQTLIGGISANNILTLQANSAGGNTASSAAIKFRVGDSGANEAITILNNGWIGIGTSSPQDLFHIYGIDNSDLGGPNSLQTNNIFIDGVADGDKGIVWADDGDPKWQDYIYRDEAGEFKYLYNFGSDRDLLVISESGRMGLNKQSNIMNDHPFYIGTVGLGEDDLIVGGEFDKSHQIVYQVNISAVGSPDSWQWRKSMDNGLTWSGYTAGGSVATTGVALENGITLEWRNISGHSTSNTWQFTAFPQTPQATFSVAPGYFNEIINTVDYTAGSPVYTDHTANGNSSDGAAIDIIPTGTTGAAYVGSNIRFGLIYFTLSSGGSNVTNIIEYWNGSAWTELTTGSPYYLLDTTNNLTQSGSITWEKEVMTDWVKNNPPGIAAPSYELYWVRLRKSANLAVAPQVLNLANNGDRRFAVYSGYFDSSPSMYVDSRGRTSVGGGNITGNNLLQITSHNNQNISPSYSSSILELDSEDGAQSDFQFRLSVDDAFSQPAVLLSKSRGTLAAPTTVLNGDTLGGLWYTAYVGSSGWKPGASISAMVDGDPSNADDMPTRLALSTSPDGAAWPEERMTILANGNVGIGTTTSNSALTILNASVGQGQLRVAQSDVNYAEFTVSAAGNLSLSLNGDTVTVPDANLKICAGGACPSATITGRGNIQLESDIYWSADSGFVRTDCPTDWILVPGNTTFGTKDFCVMKYGAKQNAVTKLPESAAAGAPWSGFSLYEARNACSKIGAHLLTDAERMTIARNIEATTINDLDADAGLQIATGHSDGAPAAVQASIAGADPIVSGCDLNSTMEAAANAYVAGSCEIRGDGSYGADANDKGFYLTAQAWAAAGYVSGAANKSQLRTYVLSNGQVIWDLSGNASEWVDNLAGAPFYGVATANLQWSNANLTDYETLVAGPLDYTGTPGSKGLGVYRTRNGVGGYGYLRGGLYNNTNLAGLYALSLQSLPTAVVAGGGGFRCAK